MSTRVHELAKELGLKSQDLLDRIQKWNLDVKANALAVVDPPTVEQIRDLFSRESKGAPAPAPAAKPAVAPAPSKAATPAPAATPPARAARSPPWRPRRAPPPGPKVGRPARPRAGPRGRPSGPRSG